MAKTYKTSKEPTNRIKGGLDSIIAGSIYDCKASKPKRDKVGKHSIYDKGGKGAITNNWKERRSTIKLDNGKTHTVVLKGATVARVKLPTVYAAKVNGEEVILGDIRSYSDELRAIRDEAPIENKQAHKHNHKIKVETAGYMENLRKNGRRDTGRYIESLKSTVKVVDSEAFADMQDACCDLLEEVYGITKTAKPDTFQAERKALLSEMVAKLSRQGFTKLAEYMATRKTHGDATEEGIEFQQAQIYRIKAL